MSNLTFAFTEAPAPGVRTEIVPGIDWVRLPLPFALDHVNCWFIHDDNSTCLVDSGLHTPASLECWDNIIKGTGWPQKLLVTHFHPDHSGLAGWFASQGTRVLSSEVEWGIVKRLNAMPTRDYQQFYAQWYTQHGVSQEYIDAVNVAGNSYTAGTVTPPDQCEFLSAGTNIELGGRSFEIMCGQGHSPDMLMLYCDTDKLLIAADQVLPSITPNISLTPNSDDPNPLNSFLVCLESLTALPEETLVLPSHGLPFTGLHQRIAFLIEHHQLRLKEIEQALVKEQTAAELFNLLFRRKLDHQQLSFALGETLAHLRYLENQSLVQRTERDNVTYFSAIN